MISEQKQMLRRTIQLRLAGMDAAARAAKSSEIARHLRAALAAHRVNTWLAFAPLASEPEWWLPTGPDPSSAGFPVVLDDRVRFFSATSPDHWTVGRFGVKEPIPDPAREIPLNATDAILVPGRAFDRAGYRLGRGGGWYDRVLSHLPSKCLRIGIAFDSQRVESVPREPHDQAVNCVITESGVHPV